MASNPAWGIGRLQQRPPAALPDLCIVVADDRIWIAPCDCGTVGRRPLGGLRPGTPGSDAGNELAFGGQLWYFKEQAGDRVCKESTTVPNNPTQRRLPPRVVDVLETTALRIRAAVAAARLWEEVLTESERARMGGHLSSLWCQRGTAGIWMQLRGVSRERAVVEVAAELGLLAPSSTRWLLRELGEVFDDPDEAIQAARVSTALVLVERPRTVYWNGAPIAVAWERHAALWQFFWELCRRAKAGSPLDPLDLGEWAHRDSIAKQKSRLLGKAGFPIDLGALIKPTGRRTQKLDVPPPQIRLFELVSIDSVRERAC